MSARHHSLRHASRLARQERGFVLVTALMFLIVLTILGLSIMSTNTLEERMAGYVRDRRLAQEAAEAALRDAERDLLSGTRVISGTMGFQKGCSDDGLCLPETDGTPIWVDLDVSKNAGWLSGKEVTPSVGYHKFTPDAIPADEKSSDKNVNWLKRVAAPPRYITEAISVTPAYGSLKIGLEQKSQPTAYRVTAVGFGQRTETRVMLQALFYYSR